MENTAFKGAILVLIGILAGVLILAVALDEPAEVSTTSTTTTQVSIDVPTPGADGDGVPTTSTFEDSITLRDPSTVRVLVANGSGVNGAAGFMSNVLSSQNYLVLTPTNANSDQDSSSIFYLPGWRAEALAIASLFNIPDADAENLVKLLPLEFDVLDDIEDAKVVIVLGGPDQLVPETG